MGESFLDKNGGGLKIDGIIKDYYVYAGENINPGSFVEFVNGIASTTTETSVDTQLSAESHSGYVISAVKLPDGKVFIAHSVDDNSGNGSVLYGMVVTIDKTAITYGTDTLLVNYNLSGATISTVLLPNGNVFIAHNYGSNHYLYGIVCTISGTTITVGTKTKLNNTAYAGFSISASLLTNGNVFVAHSYNTKYYLYGIICTISGTTITIGTDTELSSTQYTGYAVSTSLLPNGNVFVAHSYGSDRYLYGIICTISGTTITTGADTALSGDYLSGWTISTQVLKNGNVFIAHNYGSDQYLYGIVCTISGTKITSGTDVALREESYAGNEISAVRLNEGKVVVFHRVGSATGYLRATIPTIDGTTITKGNDYNLNTTTDAGFMIDAVVLPNENVLVAHSSDITNYYLNAQIFGVTDNVPSNNVIIPTYETQVRNVTSSNANGIAKTSGVGGDSTGHNEQIQVYVPKTVTYMGDIIPKSWTAITEGTEYISSDGTILSANGTDTDTETRSVDKACDGNTGTLVRFLSNNRTWIKLKFPKAIKITKMSLWRGNTSSTTTTYIQGSNNDTDWNILYTINEFADSQGVQELNVDLNNPDYYLYYRIYIPEAATNFIYEWQTTEYEVIE